MVNYLYLADIGEAPRPHCTMCAGPAGRVHVVVKKLPRGELGVLCERCALAARASIPLLRAVELAVTMEKSFPELAAWMARYGVWEIPTTHEDLAIALGVPLGLPRGIWSDA